MICSNNIKTKEKKMIQQIKNKKLNKTMIIKVINKNMINRKLTISYNLKTSAMIQIKRKKNQHIYLKE